MPNDFFSTFNPAGIVKDVTDLAMKKHQLDQAANRFTQEMGMKKQALDIENQKFLMAKDQITTKNRIEQAVREKISGMTAPQTTTTPSSEDISTTARLNAVAPEGGSKIDPSLIPSMTTTRTPRPSAEDLARAVVSVDPSTANLKELVAARKAETDAARLESTEKDRAYYQSEMLRLRQEALTKEKPRTSKLLTPEEEAQQVRIAKTKAEQGPGQFKPGTLDYMIEKYETDGQIPPFGMGAVGAKQRAAFFDKAAERARQRGDTGGEQAVRGAEFKSSQSTLTDLTKREQLIESFNVRINQTSDKVLIPLIKKWDLQNPRFLNWPVNKLGEIMGSGDLAAMKLALNSISVEVGKVEFNALGIQQLTDSAAKFMNSVHDPNMSVGDLLKVIDTSKALGKTGSDAISGQRKSLRNRIEKIAPTAGVDNDPLGIRKAK